GPSRPPPSDLPLDRFGGPVRVAALAAAATTRTSATAGTPATAARPATTAARTPAATAAARARRLRVGDLHRDPATVQLAAVDLGDCVLGIFGAVHLDEAEAA